MSTENEFGEPWTIVMLPKSRSGEFAEVRDSTGFPICDDEPGNEAPLPRAFLERAVACVNACRGISTEELQRCELRLRLKAGPVPGFPPLGVGARTREALAELIGNKRPPIETPGYYLGFIEALAEAIYQDHGIEFPIYT